jgi:hypothetical protein
VLKYIPISPDSVAETAMSDNKKKDKQPDPSTYMRSRHPDLYSDSESVETSQLTQDVLEYQLETLTNRNQETEFAYFARRLAQKEICPNLRPQTGPVGGGDSKVDSETIPVSSEIADIWVGADPAAASEHWAFAFSAKKTWKSKVADDVKKIAGTDRGYTKIYFITNQFAPDKSRAESEDTLSKKYGIPVVILDRSWIVKAVLENGRQQLAIDALHIDTLKMTMERRVGPADRERQQELDDLEKAINEPDSYAGAPYQLFEDCLQAAKLTRGLERPRAELDGLFKRAQRMADNLDDDHLRLRVAYNYAWTVIFWFDDHDLFNQMYDTVAPLALKSIQSEEVERAVNLWMVLSSQADRSKLTKEAAKLDEREAAIVARLDELIAEDTRPNNALQAKTSRALLELYNATSRRDMDAINAVWKTFRKIVEDSEPLGDYPFERLPPLIKEFGPLGQGSDEFDKLFELIVAAMEKRRGEATGAELLSERGFQKLEANQPYEAISLLGRAMERFIKREHRDDLIFCLMGLSQAYHSAGLNWAARSCALAATERCLAYYREDGTIVRRSLICLQQLQRIELFLGRIPQVLMALDLERVLVPQLKLQAAAMKRAQDNRQLMEGMVGILFLGASLDQLKRMADMPEALEGSDLVIPKACLMYALGYVKELAEEGFPESDKAETFMKLAYQQPGRLQMPDRPQIDDGLTVNYSTNVLGCDIELTAQANVYAVSVAEAVLGSLEAFFATSLNERILPYRQSAHITLRPAFDLKAGLVVSEETEAGEVRFVVLHPVSAPEMTQENRMADRDGLMAVIARFIAFIAVIDDFEKYFEKIAGEERGFARALVYSEASLAQENLYGNKPQILIGDWKREGAKPYPLVRTAEWHSGMDIKQIPLPDDGDDGDPCEPGEPPGASGNAGRAEFERRMAQAKHSDRQISSLIDLPLWNKAEWGGTMFYFDPRKLPHPVLALAFRDQPSAGQIFKGLAAKLGKVDTENKLRVTIVRGIQKSNPAAYRVVIGTNIDRQETGKRIFMMVNRTNVMEPTTTENLARFLAQLKSSPEFFLAPAIISTESGTPRIGFALSIQKSELIVRNAWEIGAAGDVDVMGLSPGDDPVIPDGVENPPCVETLAFIRSTRRSE